MNDEKFDVLLSKTENDEVVLTSTEKIEKITEQWLLNAMNQMDATNGVLSVHLNDSTAPQTNLTIERVKELATGAQNDLTKVLSLNAIIRTYVNHNYIVGRCKEIIEINANSNFRLSYEHIPQGKIKKKQFQAVQELISHVNSCINIKRLIKQAVSTVYTEGNWIANIRTDGDLSYVVDQYPLGVCEIADYEWQGKPIVLFNVTDLRDALQKQYLRYRNGQPVFVKNIEEEVQLNYPSEIYEAFKKKEEIAKLDPRYSGVVKINDMNRKYGVSPILRALCDLILLDTFDQANDANARSRKRTILFQKIDNKVGGDKGVVEGFDKSSHAHYSLVEALRQQSAVYTGSWFVEDLKYIEPKGSMLDTESYRAVLSKIITSMGLTFSMSSGSASSATEVKIGYEVLLKFINSISELLENVFEGWYRQIIIDNNLPPEYAPKMTILDAEALNPTEARDLATFLYNVLGASRETVFETVGLNVKDEMQKRKVEEEEEYNEIFVPYATSFNSKGGGNEGGRPPDQSPDDPDKQLKDQTNRSN